jgi:hypothetical protein
MAASAGRAREGQRVQNKSREAAPERIRPHVIGRGILLAVLAVFPRSTHAQATPLELMAGGRYATINLVMSRSLADGSRWGLFHQSTITADYDDEDQNDLGLQQLLLFEPLRGFRLTGGAFYGRAGLNGTAGMQYVNAGRALFLLLSPRVNIESDPSFSVFTIVRYRSAVTEKAGLYLGLQALNTFDLDSHIKSYQWLRFGLDLKGTQGGVAVNLDESGPHPDLQVSVGLFVRREIP